MEQKEFTTGVNRTLNVVEVFGSPSSFGALRHAVFLHDQGRIAFCVEVFYVLRAPSGSFAGGWFPAMLQAAVRILTNSISYSPVSFFQPQNGQTMALWSAIFFDARRRLLVAVVGIGVLAAYMAFVCRASHAPKLHTIDRFGQRIHIISKECLCSASNKLHSGAARLRTRQAGKQQRQPERAESSRVGARGGCCLCLASVNCLTAASGASFNL